MKKNDLTKSCDISTLPHDGLVFGHTSTQHRAVYSINDPKSHEDASLMQDACKIIPIAFGDNAMTASSVGLRRAVCEDEESVVGRPLL